MTSNNKIPFERFTNNNFLFSFELNSSSNENSSNSSSLSSDNLPICSICMCPVDYLDEDFDITQCQHIFHVSCLKNLKEKSVLNCPLCRQPLVSELFSHHNHPIKHNHHHNQSHHQNHHIVEAASRGRNAVRNAMERRQTSSSSSSSTSSNRRNAHELYDPFIY